MTDLGFFTASDLAPLIKAKQLSPVELTKHILNRIDTIDPTIHSYITPLHELALKQAGKAENEIMYGRYKGPLHGIPIGIKDNFDTKGIRTTAGSKLFVDFIPDKTATTVEKLLAAGGIMLGKLNMHELALGSTGTNQTFGTTRNPWNIEYMPGGSSGGSSAALAAGLATLATGTDTFGSIRLPAAMCGIYGLKPTYGLVSTYGVIPSAWSLDHAGPMARSVSDLALMLDVMAGFDADDPASLHVPIPNYTEDLNKGMRGVKIGIPKYYLEGLESDVEKLFKNAITTLKGLGAELIEIEIPELSMATFSGYVTVSGEASTFHYEWLQTHVEDYGADNRIFLLSGTLTNTPQYVKAQQARRKMVEAFHNAFKDIDILLGPTIPITTPAFAQNWVDQNLEVIRRCLPFTVPVNLTGLPSLAVPMGFDQKGLPVGMQFIGNHLSEKQLLQVGYAWERINPFRFRIAD
ncbi:Asp-tRNA(Asn)/Glu-tRNA(Gln) amidotransferase GatCAB subunit A [Bacilli bacterium]|nr:glutamyl-tRNA amidotransferase [Bacilli bacterium VT-13-104]PZD89535.1 Asp-tRNA(Asn)/Glu-tRNA(Gln) amidotransferase GatCAB subunit A [Bacilli bacterium]PZD91057.1 Asp-tRNA(Asn)/Glu-tRNA(Gln) amidotransferase GatCAB subunit A [Bacilli bacterium]PZD92604.1 Asp-tRNA(Asn)/Glu-tRNA(Gln) amidotransferase GatCAB subunit A [Bacilli bacterium]RCO07557.1 Asp-tRNA(Asn)/Glu-tRNA(Gln) amidotransferase GatCAB subunit A [Bacilli bacterium]